MIVVIVARRNAKRRSTHNGVTRIPSLKAAMTIRIDPTIKLVPPVNGANPIVANCAFKGIG